MISKEPSINLVFIQVISSDVPLAGHFLTKFFQMPRVASLTTSKGILSPWDNAIKLFMVEI